MTVLKINLDMVLFLINKEGASVRLLFCVSNYFKTDKNGDALYDKKLMVESINTMMSGSSELSVFTKHNITHDVMFQPDFDHVIENYAVVIYIDGKVGFEEINVTSIRYNFILGGVEFTYEKVKSIYKTLRVVFKVIESFTNDNNELMGLVWKGESFDKDDKKAFEHDKKLNMLVCKIMHMCPPVSFTTSEKSSWVCTLQVDSVTETKHGIFYDTPRLVFKNSVTEQEILHPEYYTDILLNYINSDCEEMCLSMKYDGIVAVNGSNGFDVVFNHILHPLCLTKS